MTIDDLTTEQINQKLQLKFKIEALKIKLIELNTQCENAVAQKIKQISKNYEAQKNNENITKEDWDNLITSQNEENKTEEEIIKNEYNQKTEDILEQIGLLQEFYDQIVPEIIL